LADPATDKEKAIVEAARKRFAHYGFSKVTMDEIASDVAMGKASLYYYFSTKESIFEAVILHEQKHFITEIQSILRDGKPAKDKLKEYAERRLVLFRDLLNLSNLPFQKFSDVKSLFKNLFSNFEREELKLLQQILQLGKHSGEFSVTASQHIAEVVLHALYGLRVRAWRNVDGQRLDDDTYTAMKKEMNLLVDLIVHGIRSK
jgi:TetR/AcrR family transcriptional regulator